jgi:glycogen debranching enzyme
MRRKKRADGAAPAPTKRSANAPKKESEKTKLARKQRVLSHVAPSFTASIADATVIKREGLFFLTSPDGRVPVRGVHGLGLYYHDCRYLDGYELQVNGGRPRVLAGTAPEGDHAVLELTNPDTSGKKSAGVGSEVLGIRWDRKLDGARLTLTDTITLRNYSQRDAKVSLDLSFRSRFEDIFVVRGMLPVKAKHRFRQEVSKDSIVYSHRGIDEATRKTSIRMSPRPKSISGNGAGWTFTIEPRETAEVSVTISVSEDPDASEPAHIASRAEKKTAPTSLSRVGQASRPSSSQTHVSGDDPNLGRLLQKSLSDLQTLRTNIGGAEFFAAGVPWFVTLFGRDSIVTALQTLAFDSSIAEQTLRVLARYQGKQVDAWREEQPGKVLHELRVDELTRANLLPYSPYYGTIDATPLFLILVARHAAWTGKLDLFDELREHIDLALTWIAQYGMKENGYVAYDSNKSDGTLVNQGWKDSGDAIVNADGSLAVPPIALVEVQAYVYKAKCAIADLFRRAGEPERATELEREAMALRTRFNRDFWSEKLGCYVLALQRDDAPAAVVSSNPGHALWCDIADPKKARRTMERLMSDEMFSGWGIRTLASSEKRYSPIAYHLGTVWPHDNSIIAAGFRRYGFDRAAQRVISGILSAAMRFEHFRLPELFSGFSSGDFDDPVRYPVANHPQAWGAGSVPFMVTTLLGLQPDAFSRKLRIVRPLLPEFVERLDVVKLRVGAAKVDLRFRRTAKDVTVDILRLEGELEVVVELEPDDTKPSQSPMAESRPITHVAE